MTLGDFNNSTATSMTNRPHAHVLEGLSVTAFRANLPAQWVFREEHPDYGIDGVLEVFSSEGAATGLRCLVQLKATHRLRGRPSVRLRKRTAEYYTSLAAPLLVVLYIHTPEPMLFARWFHEFDPYYGGTGVDHIQFLFERRHQWSNSTGDELHQDLLTYRTLSGPNLPLPIPFSVAYECPRIAGLEGSDAELIVRRALRQFRRLFREADKPSFVVQLAADEIRASFRGLHKATLHSGKATMTDQMLAAEAIILTGIALASAGDHNSAVLLYEAAAGNSRMLSNPDVSFRIAVSFNRAGQLSRALRLAERLLAEPETASAADALLVATLPLITSDHDSEELQLHLAHRISLSLESGDVLGASVAHYNMANHLRSQGRFREALHHYRAAAEHNPAYQQREYYHREVASVLFLSGRYRAAASCYRTAIRFGAPSRCKALYADALMFSGQLEQAKKELESYISTVPDHEMEWSAKHFALTLLLDILPGIGGRDSHGAAGILSSPVGVDDSDVSMNALAADPLAVDAWLRLASSKRDTDINAASGALLIAANIAGRDPVLWAQAIVHCIIAGWDQAAIVAAAAACELTGSSVVEEVDRGLKEMNLPSDQRQALLDPLIQVESSIEKRRQASLVEIRLAGDTAEYSAMSFPIDGGELPST